ncbi:hypothetical protein CBR_g34485 [Chara braunii]|uniref:Myb/SANT-like DNA-binding domain-containing protein n=1 Tax=Chara braunii TaxID=69332 RepID=A0A388LJ05_CHABU|nr:hypothetical protein CBR_g34485 [Chara braunii]|eukprot:GBG82202.1 hypothetical protein CBR_g34485 [Chara braunii]
MADVCRRLPLLILVAILLLVVVVFHICILGRVHGRKHRRRTTKETGKMEKVQTKRTMSVGAGGSSRQRCSSAEGGRSPYDPTLYSHLPSHEIPLPPSDDDSDEPRSSTVPLGSGSTQDWMGSQLYRQTPTYTDLLEGRTPVGYDGGLVDLSFGLRSGSGQDVTHTVLVNPGSASNHTAPSVGPCGLPDTRGRGSGHSGDERGLVSRGRTAVGTTGVRAEGTRTGGSTTAGGAVHRGGDDADGYAAEVAGQEVWDDYLRQSRQSSTSAITRGVTKINVRADDTPGDCDGAGGEDLSAGNGGNDNDDDDNGEMEIRPLGKKRGGPRATSKSSEPRAGRRGKKTAGDASAGDGAKSRDFWTVELMIALVRAKRDQDLHLAGLGHNMGRMKTKTWKWADIESRLVQMGVTTRKADDCGKKWDNLYMQFKIVHKFMGESGKPDFFSLAPRERKERGFDFRIDEHVYSKMMAMSKGDHTIHPTNLADTGAAGGVQLPSRTGGRNESGGSDGCGDGQDDDQGSTRNSSFSGSAVGGCGKRKNVRQQTFDTIEDVMNVRGASTMDKGMGGRPALPALCASTLKLCAPRAVPPHAPQSRALFSVAIIVAAPADHDCASSTCSFVDVAVVDLQASYFHVLLRPRVRRCGVADDMAPRNASAKTRQNSGAGDEGETKRGRGHIPKPKRQHVEESSSEHTADFQPEEVVMVDVQGTLAAPRLGFGRDGLTREQVSAVKQSIVVGVAGASQRTPKAAGVVITEPLPLERLGASGRGKAQPAQKGDATTIGTQTVAADRSGRTGVVEGAGEERVDDVRHDEGRRDEKREGDDDDDRPLVTRLKGAAKEDDLEERSKLWVDCDSFWGQGPGKPLREAVRECADYFIAIANRDAGAKPPVMLILPPNDVARFKIDDPAQRERALRRARNVEKLVLRAIHG